MTEHKPLQRYFELGRQKNVILADELDEAVEGLQKELKNLAIKSRNDEKLNAYISCKELIDKWFGGKE